MPAKRPISRRALARTAATITGLRFWGMMLLESMRLSGSWAKPVSFRHHLITSSARRARVPRASTAAPVPSSM